MSEDGIGLQRINSSQQSDGAPSILSHLLTLPNQTILRLYSFPSNTLSIFRLVPPLARHLILTLLFLPDPPQLASTDVAALLSRNTAPPADEAAIKSASSGRRSRSLRGLEETKDVLSRLKITREQNGIIYLNAIWTKSLRRALIGGGDHQSFGVPSENDAESRLTARQLDEFALQSWESILLYMVASVNVRTPSRPVLYLLRTAGLMQPEEDLHTTSFEAAPPKRKAGASEGLLNMSITSNGFQFLLEDVSSQLWLLLHTYLITLAESSAEDTRDSTSADIVEHMTFLFTLSSATLGQDYDVASLKPSQREMLVFFRDLGLVYQRSDKSANFYPTRLVTTLTNASQLPLMSNNQDSEEEKGFVILETNYKVYAYTSECCRELRCSVRRMSLTLYVSRQQTTHRRPESVCEYPIEVSKPSDWNHHSRQCKRSAEERHRGRASEWIDGSEKEKKSLLC
jgi:transcription initiation factor TFIIH subunit 4